MAAYEDMMETRSTFADYVGNLADAFNVSDATKKAMMQFGDAIAQELEAHSKWIHGGGQEDEPEAGTGIL